MTIKSRLAKIKAKEPKKPKICLTVIESTETPGTYLQNKQGIFDTGPDSVERIWTRQELDALGDDYQVIIISWTNTPYPDDKSKVINFK
jgi:hypothetical protein